MNTLGDAADSIVSKRWLYNHLFGAAWKDGVWHDPAVMARRTETLKIAKNLSLVSELQRRVVKHLVYHHLAGSIYGLNKLGIDFCDRDHFFRLPSGNVLLVLKSESSYPGYDIFRRLDAVMPGLENRWTGLEWSLWWPSVQANIVIDNASLEIYARQYNV